MIVAVHSNTLMDSRSTSGNIDMRAAGTRLDLPSHFVLLPEISFYLLKMYFELLLQYSIAVINLQFSSTMDISLLSSVFGQ